MYKNSYYNYLLKAPSGRPLLMITHTPVLLHQAICALQPQPGKLYVDGTLGGGGHALELLKFLDNSNYFLGIDQDPVALERAKELLLGHSNIRFSHGNFSQLLKHLLEHGFSQVDGGVLLDLGVSDFQIKAPERGFSFMHEAPLDMKMNPDNPVDAQYLVNESSEETLATLLYQYGDERYSRQIAKRIVQERPVVTTTQLAKLICDVYGSRAKQSKIHPATRSFQALRIAVNREQESLAQFLEAIPSLLKPGARLAIISFHSGEDRVVKHQFRAWCNTCTCPPRQPICTCQTTPMFKAVGKDIAPDAEEIAANPQSRSARLRMVERL
jgi:16S rRNA (cytosine1402-N4)-methyltransferase